MRILVTDSWIARHVEEIRGDFPAVEFVIPDSDEEKTAAAADAEVASGSVTAKLLAAAPRLKWVHSTSAGVEWMPPELAATDIVVTNTRGAHASTIAEHGFGMLVYLARRFEDLRQAQRDKVWLRPPPQPTVALAGMTMGVIGLGNIGRAIAVRAHAFEMRMDRGRCARGAAAGVRGGTGPARRPGRPVAPRRRGGGGGADHGCHARHAEPGAAGPAEAGRLPAGAVARRDRR